jgi:putative transposase
MSHLDYATYARRHRPHIHPIGAILFLTYRLAGTVPKDLLRFYKAKGTWIRQEVARVTKSLDLDNPLAKQQLERLDEFERGWFLKFEEVLHKTTYGPLWLKDEQLAQIVCDGLKELDGEAYRLDAYSIMSNHVHVVFKPLLEAGELIETIDPNGKLIVAADHPSLARIMQSLKGKSARLCNQFLGRQGRFWEHENFDRVVRADRFNSTIRYVLNNPVKAGLVSDWREWRWNYLRSDLSDRF